MICIQKHTLNFIQYRVVNFLNFLTYFFITMNVFIHLFLVFSFCFVLAVAAVFAGSLEAHWHSFRTLLAVDGRSNCFHMLLMMWMMLNNLLLLMELCNHSSMQYHSKCYCSSQGYYLNVHYPIVGDTSRSFPKNAKFSFAFFVTSRTKYPSFSRLESTKLFNFFITLNFYFVFFCVFDFFSLCCFCYCNK